MTEFITNVPQPTYGDNGIVLPTEAAILSGIQADINTALGGGIDSSLTTPQGQLATTETAAIGDSQAQLAWYVNQVDPATSSGRMQDALGRIYALTRIPAEPTVQPCTCYGLNNAPIPIGSLAQDQAGNLWSSEAAGTITNGSVLINFQSVTLGPIPAPISLKPYTFVTGWESITPTGSAVLGQNVESRAAFEQRRENAIAANSLGMLGSVLGSVLGVPGVLDAYVQDNPSSVTQTIGGVSLLANSIYTCVVGGSAAAIAMAIFMKKPPGCVYTGTTAVTIADPNPQYAPPAPLYTIRFTFAIVTNFAVVVTLKNNGSVPANVQSLVASAIINAFSGLDGGPRAKIGSLVLSSRYYAGVIALGFWAEIIEIQLGLSGAACSFTGSISGNMLTVTAVNSGTLAIGQLIQDSGLISTGTVISSLGTGNGGIGTYILNNSQTVSSEAMNATTLYPSVQMNINQEPAVSASNVNIILQ